MTGSCNRCGDDCDPRTRVCRRCLQKGKAATPLRKWHTRSNRSYAYLSKATGLGYRTILRVAAGQPASGKTALSLNRVTGIPCDVLIRGSGG